MIHIKDMWWVYYFGIILISTVWCAEVLPDEPEEQGLYRKSDQVHILTAQNFDRKVYHQKHAMIVQFYNSYCGHCRAFAPKFKQMAGELNRWSNTIQLGVVDCSVEENNEVCRQFEVMAYPTMRYIHENYVKGNSNMGEKISPTETVNQLIDQIIYKLQAEQAAGRLTSAPSLSIGAYRTFQSAIQDLPRSVLYTFFVFEDHNSTLGSKLALDMQEYRDIKLKRAYDSSELASAAGVRNFPSIVAVKYTLETTNITPANKDAQSFIQAVSAFLVSKNYKFPRMSMLINENKSPEEFDKVKPSLSNTDFVYYSDLEKTLKTSLHTEITRYKTLSGDALQALYEYLDVLLLAFPFKGTLKDYIRDLRSILSTRDSWSGAQIYDTVQNLENTHAPVFSSDLEYIGCKGSEAKYRGYSCGLWTLFHTLTVNAARLPNAQGPRVLRAMHGYVKHFFGCTDCSEHFQAMAARNKIFDVKENDKAVLWLWISHNEVNLRLAGDVTEDPKYPKVQFPSISKCPKCRLVRGAWNLPAVYAYLQSMYGAENVRETRAPGVSRAFPGPFSSLDIGMLSLLYIFSFVILILVIKYLLTKRFYRKRPYKHGRGKV